MNLQIILQFKSHIQVVMLVHQIMAAAIMVVDTIPTLMDLLEVMEVAMTLNTEQLLEMMKLSHY